MTSSVFSGCLKACGWPSPVETLPNFCPGSGKAGSSRLRPPAQGHRPGSVVLASTDSAAAEPRASSAGEPPHRVVVLGGTGRVGGSTAAALAAFSQKGDASLALVLASRSKARGQEAAERLGGGATSIQCDVDDFDSVASALEGADLVIHAAGPFQRKGRCTVLEAAVATKTPYIDVCDDQDYSQLAKALHPAAEKAGVPAIITAGIYPGVSNCVSPSADLPLLQVMAAELVRLAQAGSDEADPGSKAKSLRFSYFTAGSGGAGPTILATTFLLLGEGAVVFREGKQLLLAPYSNCRVVDFGKGIGSRPVYLLNLPEVASAHQLLGIPTVSARFGTSPQVWNWAMEIMARLVPAEVLRDRRKVEGLVQLTDGLVRVVDNFVGERVAMRVDLECENGRKAVGLYSHKYLSRCVGQATAAFALAVLEGSTQPGVWFPEEAGGVAVSSREKLLQRSAADTINYFLNRAPWMVDKAPREIGFGLYW